MVNLEDIKIYQKNGWLIDDLFIKELSDYEKSFIDLELGTYKSLEFYKSRLLSLEFENMSSVLDAGCGIGQWSLALSSLNKSVCGIDLMPSRISLANYLANAMAFKNIDFKVGALEDLPYENESFDAVFCYGVFMFTHVDKTLAEFKRVLKPGGKLYFNFNSLGWYAHLILDRGIYNGNMKIIKQALRMCFRYFMGCKSQILIREHWIKQRLENFGFYNLRFASEGQLTSVVRPNEVKPKSIYQSNYYGMRSVIEVTGNI